MFLQVKTMCANVRVCRRTDLRTFKSFLPTRYYYTLFGIQNLCEVGGSSKCVMAREKLNNRSKFSPFYDT